MNSPEHNLIEQQGNPPWFWIAVGILGVIAVLAIATICFAEHARHEFSIPNAAQSDVAVTVTSGESIQTLSNDLQSKQAVPSAFWFRSYLRLRNLDAQVNAGTFTIPRGSDIRQVAFQLTQAPNPERLTLRIPEGATVNDIAALVQQNVGVSSGNFIAAEQQAAAQYDYLISPPGSAKRPTVGSLEGYLFPDTYYFEKGVSAQDIILKILANTSDKITPDIRQQAAAQQLTLNQVITVASLIEKEVGSIGGAQRDPGTVQHEREVVAGIIYNRLNAGMALQLDSTKKYDPPGMTAADPAYDTYAHTGLPPGPISNPSLDSIEAAANPIASNYMYFITAPDGTAYFATTLAQQNANIAKYLK